MKASTTLVLWLAGLMALSVASSGGESGTQEASKATEASEATPRPPENLRIVADLQTTPPMDVLRRKATLYGLNSDLLQAVVLVESRKVSEAGLEPAEWEFLIENSARTLRHCLLRKRFLTQSLQAYSCGSLDPNAVKRADTNFANEVKKAFRELQKQSEAR